jgi:hypothetical protein
LLLSVFASLNKQEEETDNTQTENSVINNGFPFDEGNKILFLKYADKLGRKDGEEKFNKLKLKFEKGDKEAENTLYKLLEHGITSFNNISIVSCGKSIFPSNIGEVNYPNRTEEIKKIVSEYDKEIIKCNEFNKKHRTTIIQNNTSADYDELQQRIDELEQENEERETIIKMTMLKIHNLHASIDGKQILKGFSSNSKRRRNTRHHGTQRYRKINTCCCAYRKRRLRNYSWHCRI